MALLYSLLVALLKSFFKPILVVFVNYLTTRTSVIISHVCSTHVMMEYLRLAKFKKGFNSKVWRFISQFVILKILLNVIFAFTVVTVLIQILISFIFLLFP